MNEEDRVTLREFVTAQLDGVQDRLNGEIAHIRDRLDRTERDLERRLAGMNEFREQLRQQAGDFIMKDVYSSDWTSTNRRISDLEKTKNIREGQIALIAVAIVVILQMVNIVYHWAK